MGSVFPQKIALVVPTLREAGNLQILLGRVCGSLDSLDVDYELLIVDDDSCDGTIEIVNGISAREPRVRLLVRKRQRGLAGAILHGWENTDASVLGVMDADLQHPPELLGELIGQMRSGCDLCIASRYAPGGAVGRWNPARKALSAAAVLATWPIQRTGLRARDPMSGFFFVRRQCIEGIEFQEFGFKLLLEILVRARITSVCEIPLAFGTRHCGASKASLRVALDYGRLLTRLYREPVGERRHYPVPEVD